MEIARVRVCKRACVMFIMCMMYIMYIMYNIYLHTHTHTHTHVNVFIHTYIFICYTLYTFMHIYIYSDTGIYICILTGGEKNARVRGCQARGATGVKGCQDDGGYVQNEGGLLWVIMYI